MTCPTERLIAKCGNVNVYKLIVINILFEESQLIDRQCKLVREKKLQRHQKKKFPAHQHNIFTLWDSFKNNTMDTKELRLRLCL
jgi:hypothetical protein